MRLPEIGPPEGETVQGKRKRHTENLVRFWNWAEDNQYNIHISYPRSGKDWLRWMIGNITEKKIDDPFNINYSNYDDFLYFTRHGGRHQDIINIRKGDNGVILLIRDPRDAALSSAYRQVVYSQHDIKIFSEEVVNSAVEDVCDGWQSRIEAYFLDDPLVVQYEAICLKPVKTISKIIEFLEADIVNPIEDIVKNCDRKKIITEVDPGEHKGKNLKQEIQRIEYSTNHDRYVQHCLKWQRDTAFTTKHNEMVYNSCEKYMKEFGYNKGGHDIEKFGG